MNRPKQQRDRSASIRLSRTASRWIPPPSSTSCSNWRTNGGKSNAHVEKFGICSFAGGRFGRGGIGANADRGPDAAAGRRNDVWAGDDGEPGDRPGGGAGTR